MQALVPYAGSTVDGSSCVIGVAFPAVRCQRDVIAPQQSNLSYQVDLALSRHFS